MQAAEMGNSDMVTLLIKANADPFKVTVDNETALDIAKKNNNPEIAEKLEKYMATYQKK